MKQLLCIETSRDSNQIGGKIEPVIKNEIYTPAGEVINKSLCTGAGWVVEERPMNTIYDKCLFVELPDLSDEVLKKESEEQFEDAVLSYL